MKNVRKIGPQSRLLPTTVSAECLERFPLGSLASRAAARSLIAARELASKLGPFASLLRSLPPLSPTASEALRKRIIAARARVGR